MAGRAGEFERLAGAIRRCAGVALRRGVPALMVMSALTSIGGCRRNAESGPHVLLISIDTLRADHVGLYGCARDTTPEIDRFFGPGTIFQNAMSSSPCTIPSVRQYLAGGFDARDERPVLAELLRNRGYQTAAIVSQHQLHRGVRTYARGFDHFDIQPKEHTDHHGFTARDARMVSDRAIAWLDDRTGEAPFFLWLHYFDPHDPYEPPEAFRKFVDEDHANSSGDRRSLQREALESGKPRLDLPGHIFDAGDVAHFRALYGGEIRYVDAQLGRVFERLGELGLVEESIVVLISDHGEWLGEQDRWDHCHTVRDLEIRVPFLILKRGKPLGRIPKVAEPASTLDVLPTLAGLVGIEIPAGEYHGVDLLHPPPNRLAAATWAGQMSVYDGEWKLILENGAPSYLYYSARDREERWNRLFDSRDVKERLVRHAQPYFELHQTLQAEKIEEMLREVGYIQ